MKHSTHISKYASRIKVKEEQIIDFSSDINFYQPEETFSLNTTTIANYAERNFKEFKTLLAKKYSLKKSQIALFNGRDSSIYELFKSIKKKSVFLYAPLYEEYEIAALKAKKNIYVINRIADEMEEPLEESIVVFANPSTPEGSHYEDIQELLELWIELDCTIILDETYLEFEGLESMRDKIKSYKKLYIIHSFSPFYSCAGVRVSAIFTHKNNIQKLQMPLWSISSLDVSFLKQRLVDEEFISKSRVLHLKQKEALTEILTNAKLFDEVVQSDANFVLTYSPNGEEIFDLLLKEKILSRKCGSFEYLSNNWLRFRVHYSDATKKLQNALKKVQSHYENI